MSETTLSVLRAIEHVHGHLGWLASLALVHPALLLRRPGRRALGVATAATLLSSLAAALGVSLYPSYRAALKPLIFAEAPAAGLAFERKEHLAVAVCVLAWVGLIAHVAAFRGRAGQVGGAVLAGRAHSDAARLSHHLGRVAFAAYAAAALLALSVASLGLSVAIERSF